MRTWICRSASLRDKEWPRIPQGSNSLSCSSLLAGAKAAHLIMHQLACNGILEASGFVGRASQTGRSTEFTQR